MSRRRRLSDEERALWKGFVRSITPLRPLPASAGSATPKTADALPVPEPPRVIVPRAAPAAAKPAPLAPLGRRLRQRVARGREPIDARLDLHGCTQSEAHAALLAFLHRAQADGLRTVLVVTGKGRASDPSGRSCALERGVLKRQVPLWLSLPEFRRLIVGFDDAHVSHGGHGALYVRLRRGR